MSSDEYIPPQTETETETNSDQEEKQVKGKRGRKAKYSTEEERKEARRIQQKAYRERKRNELIDLRRKAQQNETN